PEFISRVTDAVAAEIAAWQARPLGAQVSGRVVRRPAGENSGRRRRAREGDLSRVGAWPQVIPFFGFPPDVRGVIYTTNALENVHRQLLENHQDARPRSDQP